MTQASAMRKASAIRKASAMRKAGTSILVCVGHSDLAASRIRAVHAGVRLGSIHAERVGGCSLSGCMDPPEWMRASGSTQRSM